MADLEIPTGFGLWQFYMTHATIAHVAISTLGFEVATPPYTQANAAAALAAWALAVKPMHDGEVQYSRVVALIGNDGPLIRFDSGGLVVGTRATLTIAPPNVSYLLRKSTQFAGHRYRGRMYIPFVNVGGITQTGALQGAEATLLATCAAAIQTNLVGGTTGSASLRLLHGESLTVPPSAIPPPTTISLISSEGTVATQRRRLERT
jgi:hypothetical protein